MLNREFLTAGTPLHPTNGGHQSPIPSQRDIDDLAKRYHYNSMLQKRERMNKSEGSSKGSISKDEKKRTCKEIH